MDYGFLRDRSTSRSSCASAVIEPTETEALETLDAFVEAMRAIAQEAARASRAAKEAPRTTSCGGSTR